MALVTKTVRDFLVYLAGRPAYLLMTAPPPELDRRPPASFERAWLGVMALALAWGVLACGLWSLGHVLFGSVSTVPALITTVAFCLWLYRRSIVSLGEVLAPNDAPARTVVLAVGLGGLFLALRGGEASREGDLPALVQWLRPYERHYRLLLLAPLWGAWAMIIAPKFARLSPAAGAATAAFAAGCEPFWAAAALALPLGASLFYLQYLQWFWQAALPIVTVLAAAGAAWGLGRRNGLDRRALLATNLLTQLVFLLAYLAARNLGMRY